MKKCNEPNCPDDFYGKGMCKKHYMAVYRKTVRGECSIDGCTKPLLASGLCNNHYALDWKTKNPEARKRHDRTRYQNNRHKWRAYIAKRQGTIFNAEYDGWVDEDVWDRDKGICQICLEPVSTELTDKYDPMYPNIDHIVGVAKGGTHLFENVRLTHRICNTSRTDEQEALGV